MEAKATSVEDDDENDDPVVEESLMRNNNQDMDDEGSGTSFEECMRLKISCWTKSKLQVTI